MRQLSRSFLSSIKRNCFSSILTKNRVLGVLCRLSPKQELNKHKKPSKIRRLIFHYNFKYFKHPLERALPSKIERFSTKKFYSLKRVLFLTETREHYRKTISRYYSPYLIHIKYKSKCHKRKKASIY